MSQVLTSVVAFIVALGVLVTIHEYGHFWVARRVGVKVLRFSIGFGRPLWKRTAGPDQTEYVIAAVPLGGYVKMLDEREGPVDSAERHRAFNAQSLLSRAAIVTAGPAANFLLAIVAYWLTFVIGISGIAPVLGEVEPDTAFGEAGFHAEDRITAVNGIPTPTWSRVRIVMLEQALDAERALVVDVVDRDGVSLARRLDLRDRALLKDEGDYLARLGVQPWWPEVEPRIGGVLDGGAAEASGLVEGDLIVSVDGQPLASWRDWVMLVRASPMQRLALLVESRDGTVREVTLRPRERSTDDGVIGFIGAYENQSQALRERLQVTVRYGPVEAFGQALSRTAEITTLTLQVLWKLVTGEAALKNISGPITIAHYAGQSASIGVGHFLNFLALISISLGILNLLPIPVLDGGHLLFLLVEAVTHKPPSERLLIFGQQLGLVLLIGLMGLAFYNDILRLIG